jgi:2-polyprenyl-3-methyl-5-hydroxy-6-metoxy-1,4-benzoquinol methylase
MTQDAPLRTSEEAGPEASTNSTQPRQPDGDGRVEVEREFWDEHVPSFDEVMRLWRLGPEPPSAAALDALEPLAGKRVLDFACGAGLTSAWLAARGAEVTGIDIAPEPLDAARSLFEHLGLEASFVCGDLREMGDELPVFDAILGQYALHHVDLSVYAPLLAARLAPGGVGAFLETMESNRLLMFARRNLAGRYGVKRMGSPDERPISREDLEQVRAAFGDLELALGQMRFARILDRQLFTFRYRAIRDAAGAIDDWLARWPRLHGLSYHRVIIVRRPWTTDP